jgi:hypothetical protein
MTAHEAAAAVLATLSEQERQSAAVYLDVRRVEAGETVDVGGSEVRAPWPAFVGFVDLAPEENWGHRCRYVFVPRDATADGDEAPPEPVMVDAQFPPFLRGAADTLRVVSVGPTVPTWALATDQMMDGESA